MAKTRRIYIATIATLILLAACTPNPANQSTPHEIIPSGVLPVASPTIPNFERPDPGIPQNTPGDMEAYPPAVQAAVQDLATRLGINSNLIEVVSFQGEEWSDSCLGLAAADEMCLQVITPGYRILLGANGKRYEYHTDQSGGVLRVIGDTTLGPIKPGMDQNQPKAILAAMQALNQATGIPISEMQPITIEAAQWSNACLDLPRPEEMCAEVITPGWYVLLVASDQHYEFHTNLNGEIVRQR